MTDYMDLRPRARALGEVEVLNPDLSPMDYLLARMRDPTTDRITARDRLAIALLPFFAPKLMATAVIDGKDFASLLDRRIAHMRRVEAARLEEPKPAAQVEVEIKPHLPTVPDRRFRRI
jgi:hypothetical protein